MSPLIDEQSQCSRCAAPAEYGCHGIVAGQVRSFDACTLHREWVDQVKTACPDCQDTGYMIGHKIGPEVCLACAWKFPNQEPPIEARIAALAKAKQQELFAADGGLFE